MQLSLMNESVREDNYGEYIDKIINIFRLSSKNSSILFRLKIVQDRATIKLSIINQSGASQEYSDVVMNCDTLFYQSFLIPLVEQMNETITINVKDIVNLDGDSLYTFRMVTENNDLFTIDGLSYDDANHLLERVNKTIEEKKPLIVPNNEGKGNFWIFLLMIAIFVVAFIVFISFK